ncbi:MAG: FAD-binding oxidoreductase [Candidatus Tectomicrobia bacterium]
MSVTAEAVIVGGGVMGCSIQYNLAQLGMTDTLLLEKDVLASGSTSRSQAILRMHYSNEVTTRLAWESLKVFQNFDAMIGGPSGYTRTGYFLIVNASQREAMQANVAMHKALGVNVDVVSAEAVREIAPMLAVEDNEAFAYEPESGYADPYSVTTGYARRARELGAQIKSRARVVEIEITGGRVSAVVTTDERIETPTVVVAAGPWSGPLLQNIGVDLPIRPLRHQVVMLRRPQDRVPDHPIIGDVVYEMSARPDVGNLTLIGLGEDEYVGPDDYNQGVDMPLVEATCAKLVKRMPGMRDALFRGGWSGLFTVTPDWHPIMDRIDGIDGLYVAVGFSGHGFKESPMIGLTIAELIVHGRASSIDISMLDAKRFTEGRELKSRYGMAVLA